MSEYASAADEMAEGEDFARQVKQETDSAKKRQERELMAAMQSAFEFGFRCCEKGQNLQMALETFNKSMRS